jgi:hypothetical protein
VDADVAFAKGSQYRIRNCMHQGICIGMSIRSAIRNYVDPTQHKRSPFDEAVSVATCAYAEHSLSTFPVSSVLEIQKAKT